MIALETHPRGTVLPIRAHAGARRNAVTGQQSGMLKVSVTQTAEKGKANRALIALLSKALAVRRSQLEMIAGETAVQKRVLVLDVDRAELARRIDRLLAERTPDDAT